MSRNTVSVKQLHVLNLDYFVSCDIMKDKTSCEATGPDHLTDNPGKTFKVATTQFQSCHGNSMCP